MSVTALDLEPAFAADLGLADVAADRRSLLRTSAGHLFSVHHDLPAVESHSANRAYVVTLGRGSDRRMLPALFAACRRAGRTTATVAAGLEYVELGRQATLRWEPAPLLPASVDALAGHTIAATMSVIDELDPHLVVLGLDGAWGELDALMDHLRTTEHWDHTLVVALTEPERDLGLVSHWLGAGL